MPIQFCDEVSRWVGLLVTVALNVARCPAVVAWRHQRCGYFWGAHLDLVTFFQEFLLVALATVSVHAKHFIAGLFYLLLFVAECLNFLELLVQLL